MIFNTLRYIGPHSIRKLKLPEYFRLNSRQNIFFHLALVLAAINLLLSVTATE